MMIALKLDEEIQINVHEYYLKLTSENKFVHNEQIYKYLNKCLTNNVKHFQVEHFIIQSKLIDGNNERLINEFASLTTVEYF